MRASLHATLLATVVLLAQPVWGHHSTSAIFENDKRITVTHPHEGRLDQPTHRDLPREPRRLDPRDLEDSGNPPAWWRTVGVGRADFAKAGSERDRRSAPGPGRLALWISPSNSFCQRRRS